MATLRDIKNRITGVQNTQKITNAMKMVAAAKLRRAQENVINARPYAKEISKMLSHLVTEEDRNNNPYIATRKVENAAVVIVTADRGLCGAFNTNIIKESVSFINEELNSENIKPHLFCIGKKGYDYFNKRNYNIVSRRTCRAPGRRRSRRWARPRAAAARSPRRRCGSSCSRLRSIRHR